MITLKERHFKNSKRKKNYYVQEDPHSCRRNSEGQKDWHDVFRVQKGKKKKKNFQPKILYKAKLLFRIERDRKSFPDKQKQK